LKTRTRRRFEIAALVFTTAAVIIAAIPLFNRNNDALLIALILGTFGSGAAFANLVNGRKQSNRN